MTEDQKNLILSWFSHIEQMATDRKTANGFVMSYEDCLDEIARLASDSQYYIMHHC